MRTSGKVKCMICNRRFKSLFPAHLKSHKLSLAEYRKLYPGAPFQCIELARKRSKIATRINTGRVLSEETRDKISKSVYMSEHKICGTTHPRWKGGGSYNVDWRVVRDRVIERDKHRCTKCNREAKWLDVHHLDEDPSNNAMDNLATLCRSCHGKVHNKRPTEEARRKGHEVRRSSSHIPEQVESADGIHSISIKKGVSKCQSRLQ